MVEEEGRSYYVVFVGRKPGIYTSYIDCHSQIERWNGGQYQTYFSQTTAEKAWGEYVNNETNKVGWCSLQMGYKCPYDVAEDTQVVAFAENRDIDNQLYEFSMQDTLRSVSQLHTKLFPAYTKHSVIELSGKTFLRYYVSIPSRLIGRPPVTMGRYAETDYLAREDAALLMLRRLMACTGKKIVDFNYHNSVVTQQHISGLEAQNFDLILQNGELKSELEQLKKKT